MRSFSFIPIMASEKFSKLFFFENLAFRLPWQPVKINDFDKIHMAGRGLIQEHFCKIVSKYQQQHVNKCQLYLSHYKSMETLSCHSNETT